MIWEDELDPDYRVVQGDVRFMQRWRMHLALRHNVAMDGAHLVLFRPGFVVRILRAATRVPRSPRELVEGWRTQLDGNEWDLETDEWPNQCAMSYQRRQPTRDASPGLNGVISIPWECLFWESVFAEPDLVAHAKGIFYTIRAMNPQRSYLDDAAGS